MSDTMPAPYLPLDELLAASTTSLLDADGLVVALAGYGLHGGASGAARGALAKAVVEMGELPFRTWASRRVHDNAVRGRLLAAERLSLGLRGARLLLADADDGAGLEVVVAVLREELARASTGWCEASFTVDERRVAVERARSLPLGVEPWATVLARPPAVGVGDLPAWVRGGLAPADDAALRVLARSDAGVRAAYAAKVQRVAASLELRHFECAWAEDAARLDAEAYPGGAPRVPLPHVSRGAYAQPRLAGGRLRWVAPGEIQVTLRGTEVAWGDDVVGTIKTEVNLRLAAPAEAGMAGVRLLEAGANIADQLATQFREGGLFYSLLEAGAMVLGMAVPRQQWSAAAKTAGIVDLAAVRRARILDRSLDAGRRDGTGEHEYEALAEGVLVAVAARAALHRHPPTAPTLVEVDAACDPVGDAVHLVARDRLEDALQDVPLPPGSWLGRRGQLDHWLPDAWVRGRLERGELRASATPVSAARAAVLKMVAEAGVHARSVTIPVLLAADEAGEIVDMTISVGRGYFAQADVSHGGFGPVACAAFERAWVAAGSLCGGAPYPLHAHHVEYRSRRRLGRVGHVDGASLALPAALAFLALWASHGDSVLHVHATGDLRQEGAEWRVGAVGGLVQKRQAAARARGPVVLQVFGTESADGDGEPWRLHRLADALKLDLSQVVHGGFLDVAAARAEIERGAKAVSASRPMADMGAAAGDVAWRLTALRLRHAAEYLKSAPQDDKTRLAVSRGRIFARLAAAYGHEIAPRRVGDPSWLDLRAEASKIRQRASREEVGHWLDLLELNESIQLDDWARGAALARRLEASVVQPESAASARLLGTVARFWAHTQRDRDLDRAVNLGDRVIGAFRDLDQSEVPRSRIYQATALLLAGRASEAATQLDEARQELDHPVDASYAESTRLFWHYTRARVEFALGRLAEASAHAAEADRRAVAWGRYLGKGIARVRAQVARAGGDVAGAEGLAAAIACGPDDPPYAHRIAAEAWSAPLAGALPEAF